MIDPVALVEGLGSVEALVSWVRADPEHEFVFYTRLFPLLLQDDEPVCMSYVTLS